jgi:hypothetical protein
MLGHGSQIPKPVSPCRPMAKSLCFHYGHALNISRLVNLKDCKLYRMKSHDCHVFIQTLIPLAYQDLLPKGIWDALTEISHFFRDICSNKLQTQHVERFEMNIVKTICKLEMIFLPLFFNSMEHLPIHLLLEAQFNIDGCIHSRSQGLHMHRN